MPNAIFGSVVSVGRFSGIIKSDLHPKLLFDTKSNPPKPGSLSERYGEGDRVVYIPHFLKGGVAHAQELHLVRDLIQGTAFVRRVNTSGLEADSNKGIVFVPRQRFSDYLSDSSPNFCLENLISIGDQLYFKAIKEQTGSMLKALVVDLPGKKKLGNLGQVGKRLLELAPDSVFRGLVVQVLATKVAVVWSVSLGHVAVPWTAVDSKDFVAVGDWLRFAAEANHWDREETKCDWTATLAEKATPPDSVTVSFDQSVGMTVEGVGMVTSVPKNGVGYLWNDTLGRLAFMHSNLRKTSVMPAVQALASFRAVSAFGVACAQLDRSFLTPWLVVEACPSSQRLPPTSIVNCTDAQFLSTTEGGGLRFRLSSTGDLVFGDPLTDIWFKLGSLDTQRQLLTSGQPVTMLIVQAGKSGLVPSDEFKWRAVYMAPTTFLSASPTPSQSSVSESSSVQEVFRPEPRPAVPVERVMCEADLEQELESEGEESSEEANQQSAEWSGAESVEAVERSLSEEVMAAVLGDGELFLRFSSHHTELLRKMVSQWKR